MFVAFCFGWTFYDLTWLLILILIFFGWIIKVGQTLSSDPPYMFNGSVCSCHQGLCFRCKTSCTCTYTQLLEFLLSHIDFWRALQMFTWPARDIQAFSNDPPTHPLTHSPCIRGQETGRMWADATGRQRGCWAIFVRQSVSDNLQAICR